MLKFASYETAPVHKIDTSIHKISKLMEKVQIGLQVKLTADRIMLCTFHPSTAFRLNIKNNT